MIAGGIIGAIVGTIVWLIMSSKAQARSSADALGPNPEVREVIDTALSPFHVFERLRVSNGTYRFDPISTPDAILLRRPGDMATMGYAFLIRVQPDGSGSKLSVSAAPLSEKMKKMPPQHYKHFHDFLVKAIS